MFNILDYMRKKRSNTPTSIQEVAKKELEKNRAVIESLRDYDEGKKDISTTAIDRRFRGV